MSQGRHLPWVADGLQMGCKWTQGCPYLVYGVEGIRGPVGSGGRYGGAESFKIAAEGSEQNAETV